MELSKQQKLIGKFTRGIVEMQEGERCGRLFIKASIGDDHESYDYHNWEIKDLKDLADAITAVIEKVSLAKKK